MRYHLLNITASILYEGLFDGRPRYVEWNKVHGDHVIPAEIVFCNEIQAWVFRHEDIRTSIDEDNEVSTSYLISHSLVQFSSCWVSISFDCRTRARGCSNLKQQHRSTSSNWQKTLTGLCGEESLSQSTRYQSNVPSARTDRLATTMVNVWKANAYATRDILESCVNLKDLVTR